MSMKSWIYSKEATALRNFYPASQNAEIQQGHSD